MLYLLYDQPTFRQIQQGIHDVDWFGVERILLLLFVVGFFLEVHHDAPTELIGTVFDLT